MVKCTQTAAGKATGEWKNKLINTKSILHGQKNKLTASSFHFTHENTANRLRELKPDKNVTRGKIKIACK